MTQALPDDWLLPAPAWGSWLPGLFEWTSPTNSPTKPVPALSGRTVGAFRRGSSRSGT